MKLSNDKVLLASLKNTDSVASAREMLKDQGWEPDYGSPSHEVWKDGDARMVLITKEDQLVSFDFVPDTLSNYRSSKTPR